MNYGMNQMWPTPVLKGKMNNKKLIDDVINHILLKYGHSNKISSDILGENLFDDKYFDEFKNKIVLPSFHQFYNAEFNKKLPSNFCLRAWITGYGASYAMPKHNHSGSQLSAVFYLISEDKHNGGKLVLSDPRFNANRGYTNDFLKWFNTEKYLPSSGDFIIFPSFLYHNVETFMGKLRLAMPVDLFIYE
jgi:hypothetical protein